MSQLVRKLNQFFLFALAGLSRSQRSVSMQAISTSMPGNALVRFSRRTGVKPVQPEARSQKSMEAAGPAGTVPSFFSFLFSSFSSFSSQGGPIGTRWVADGLPMGLFGVADGIPCDAFGVADGFFLVPPLAPLAQAAL
jgi:hypothetical protein